MERLDALESTFMTMGFAVMLLGEIGIILSVLPATFIYVKNKKYFGEYFCNYKKKPTSVLY